QAEDGIRDRTVTGVQTCALPIFGADEHVRDRTAERPGEMPGVRVKGCRLSVDGARPRVLAHVRRLADRPVRAGGIAGQWDAVRRSEERRVGKEGRSPWADRYCHR